MSASTPTTWAEAVGLAMSNANTGRTGAGMPKLTNQQASGLIMFARDVMSYAASEGRPVAYDWYGYALPALGWEKRGDRFDTSAAHQAADYSTANALWMALQEIATQLDSAGIPFKLLSSPIGSASTYDALAKAAWVDMQANHPLDAEASKATKAAKSPTTTTTTNDKIPDSFTDGNAVVWSLTKGDSGGVDGNVVSAKPPYSPSINRPTKPELLAAIKAYAAQMKANGYVTAAPGGDADAGDIYPSGYVNMPKKPTSGGTDGVIVLVGLGLIALALDD